MNLRDLDGHSARPLMNLRDFDGHPARLGSCRVGSDQFLTVAYESVKKFPHRSANTW